MLPVPVSNLFVKSSSIHGYNTRSCNLLHTKDSKVVSSEVTYTNFSYHRVHIWDTIVRNIPPFISYNSFKHLSKIFIQKMIYIIDYVHNLNIASTFFCGFNFFYLSFFFVLFLLILVSNKMYLYFYSIFNVGLYVSCYLFRCYYLLILVIMSI